MISMLKRTSAVICLAATPWVVAASPSTTMFIESRLSGERTEEEIRALMLRHGVMEQFIRVGVDERDAAWWAERAVETGSLRALAQGHAVAAEAVREDVWTVWQEAGAERQQVFARVVGVNVPGVLLLLLPVAIAVAVLAVAGGSAGAILGGAVLVGLIFVLLANPKFLFGER